MQPDFTLVTAAESTLTVRPNHYMRLINAVAWKSSRRWQSPVQESIRFLEIFIRRRSYIRVKISANDYNWSIGQPRRPLTVIALADAFLR